MEVELKEETSLTLADVQQNSFCVGFDNNVILKTDESTREGRVFINFTLMETTILDLAQQKNYNIKRITKFKLVEVK